jgi:hypothetical protein
MPAVLFPAGSLALARRTSEHNMPDECTRTIPGAWTDDGEGGGHYGEPAFETFRCRAARPAGTEVERLVAEQMMDPSTLVLRYPLAQALRAGETVQVTRAADGSTETYEVKSVEPLGSYDVERKAVIRKVAP